MFNDINNYILVKKKKKFLFTLQNVGGDGGEGAATDTDKPVESTPAVWPSTFWPFS